VEPPTLLPAEGEPLAELPAVPLDPPYCGSAPAVPPSAEIAPPVAEAPEELTVPPFESPALPAEPGPAPAEVDPAFETPAAPALANRSSASPLPHAATNAKRELATLRTTVDLLIGCPKPSKGLASEIMPRSTRQIQSQCSEHGGSDPRSRGSRVRDSSHHSYGRPSSAHPRWKKSRISSRRFIASAWPHAMSSAAKPPSNRRYDAQSASARGEPLSARSSR
jgi:hypothetical protein